MNNWLNRWTIWMACQIARWLIGLSCSQSCVCSYSGGLSEWLGRLLTGWWVFRWLSRLAFNQVFGRQIQ